MSASRITGRGRRLLARLARAAASWRPPPPGWAAGRSALTQRARLEQRAAEEAAASIPAILDVAEPPQGQGDHPGDHEEPDDHEAGVVDVEAVGPRPDPTGQVELTGRGPEAARWCR